MSNSIKIQIIRHLKAKQIPFQKKRKKKVKQIQYNIKIIKY